MLTCTVSIEGKTFNDLVLALEALTAKVEEEYTSGFDSNDSGRYTFDINGEEEDDDTED